MTQTAYLYRVDAREPEYVGKVELEASLQLNRPNWYFHQKQRHVIQVDRIEPTGWVQGIETIPTVYGSTPVLPKPAPPLRRGAPVKIWRESPHRSS